MSRFPKRRGFDFNDRGYSLQEKLSRRNLRHVLGNKASCPCSVSLKGKTNGGK